MLAQAARRVSHAMHRQRHDSSVHGRTHGGRKEQRVLRVGGSAGVTQGVPCYLAR